MEEPIADEVRGILDGHIVLDRRLAARGHYPAIDVLASLSRVMPSVTAKTQRAHAERARALLAAYEEKRDLIALGAYAKGTDARLDQAIAAAPDLERFLRQDASALEASPGTLQALKSIAERYPDRR
jgi:flagellar biosynthesis/type III secretory pathway ATPase